MSLSGEVSEEPVSPPPASRAKSSGLLLKIARSLLVMAICCGAIFWALRVVWDGRNPLIGAARGLKSAQPAARLAAIQEVTELGFANRAAAITALSPTLRDPDSDVRAAAAKSLGLLGSGAIRSGSDIDAVEAAVPDLFALLQDHATSVRLEAIQALGILSMTRLSDSARGARNDGGSAGADSSVVNAPQLADAAIEMLDDHDAELRLAALRAFGSVASQLPQEPPKALIAALEDKSELARTAAIDAVAGFKQNLDPFVPMLVRGLGPRESALVRSATLHALTRIQPSAITVASVPALVSTLGDDDKHLRFQVIKFLARLGRDERLAALPAFLAALKEPLDTDQPLMPGRSVGFTGPVYVSAQVLGQVAPGTPSAGKAIAALEALVESGHPQRGAAAATALAQFGPAAAHAVPALVKLLERLVPDSAHNRDAAAVAKALGRIAPGTAEAAQTVKALIAAFQARAELTREAAVSALAPFGPKAAGALPDLRALQNKETNSKVMAAIGSTLKSLEPASK